MERTMTARRMAAYAKTYGVQYPRGPKDGQRFTVCGMTWFWCALLREWHRTWYTQHEATHA